MNSLNEKILTDALNLVGENLSDYPTFVETGTYRGSTTMAMAKIFNKVFTIELQEFLFVEAKATFERNNFTNIQPLLGDSSEKLKDILGEIKGNSVFFLDGHWSGGITAKGNKDCPLLEELKIINSFSGKAVIIIDDYRLFNTRRNEDWIEITDASVTECVKNRLVKTVVDSDKMILFIK